MHKSLWRWSAPPPPQHCCVHLLLKQNCIIMLCLKHHSTHRKCKPHLKRHRRFCLKKIQIRRSSLSCSSIKSKVLFAIRKAAVSCSPAGMLCSPSPAAFPPENSHRNDRIPLCYCLYSALFRIFLYRNCTLQTNNPNDQLMSFSPQSSVTSIQWSDFLSQVSFLWQIILIKESRAAFIYQGNIHYLLFNAVKPAETFTVDPFS